MLRRRRRRRSPTRTPSLERLADAARAHDVLRIRASSTSRASRCGCWCRASARASAAVRPRLGAGEARRGRLVVIGEKGLDRAAIEAALAACHASAARPSDARSTRRRAAVDLGQTPADIVVLSFTDSDLAVLAAAWERLRARPRCRACGSPASPSCRHPYSVDLYVEKSSRHARFVLVRLLGGLDYWRYGVDELAARAGATAWRSRSLPGDDRADARLDAASTLAGRRSRRPVALFPGGRRRQRRAGAALRCCAARPPRCRSPSRRRAPAFGVLRAEPAAPREPSGAARADRVLPLAARRRHRAGRRAGRCAAPRGASRVDGALRHEPEGPRRRRAAARAASRGEPPDVILNTTAFSARLDDGADARSTPPTRRCCRRRQPARREAQWAASARGLSPADLAMNVVLPEIDGRIIAGAHLVQGAGASATTPRIRRCAPRPHRDRVAHVADLAAAWARCAARRAPSSGSPSCCPTIPAKGGRAGYAVGLDTPPSVAAIAAAARARAGYDARRAAAEAERSPRSSREAGAAAVARRLSRALARPAAGLRARRRRAPGASRPTTRPAATARFAFASSAARRQRRRAAARSRPAADAQGDYHDAALPPRHAYVAFYLWLREVERIDALIHLGTHGTLEWLPGKAVALVARLRAAAVLGADAGDLSLHRQQSRRGGAGQAPHRRRDDRPPDAAAGRGRRARRGGRARSACSTNMPRRRRSTRAARARSPSASSSARARRGLAAEARLRRRATPTTALARLDAWLCDLKEMRIGDGLHVFGRRRRRARRLRAATPTRPRLGRRSLRPLSSPPGPAGAPARGRLDVLPTGRNLYPSIRAPCRPAPPGDRPARRRELVAATPRITATGRAHRARPLGQRHDAHRRRRSRPGLALIGVRPRWDTARAASPASRSCRWPCSNGRAST